MKNKYIKWLVVSSAIAVVGLIAIQVYWISNAFTLREQEFSDHVHAALLSISQTLEQREGSAKDHGAASSSVSISAPDKENLVIDYGDGDVSVLQSNELGLSGDSVSVDPLAKAGVKDAGILSQSGILDDIMGGLLELDIYTSVIDRIDTLLLDTLVSKSLMSQGIRAEFSYGVLNKLQQPEILPNNSKGALEQLQREGFRIQLFPKDPIADPNYLCIWFPHQRQYVLSTMGMMLAT
jgi:hypothetical protein